MPVGRCSGKLDAEAEHLSLHSRDLGTYVAACGRTGPGLALNQRDTGNGAYVVDTGYHGATGRLEHRAARIEIACEQIRRQRRFAGVARRLGE